MIRDICKDELFLARKAAPALPEDLPIAQDLLETLIAHKDGCVGMAANMIGVAKRIIAFESEDGYLVMFNPVILKSPGRMRRRRAVSPSPAPERPNAGRPSRCSGRTKSSSPASRPSQAGQQRSSSMSSTTATASLSEITSGNAAKHSIPACLIPSKISKSFTFYLLISFFRDGILIISHFDPIL